MSAIHTHLRAAIVHFENHLSIALFASALFFTQSFGWTQEPAAANAQTATVTAPIVEGRIAALEQKDSLDEESKARLRDLYTQTLEQIRLGDEWRAKANEFESLRSSAADTLKAIQEELSVSPAPPPSPPSPDTPIAEIEAALAAAESELASAQLELADLDKESGLRGERRRQIPELQAGARQRLDDARQKLAAPPQSGESAELIEARRFLSEARREVAEQEIRSYEQELLSYDARGRLLSLRIDRARRRTEQGRVIVDTWRDYLKEHRKYQAQEAARNVRDPLLFQALEENQAPDFIVEQAKKLAAQTSEIIQARTSAEGILRKSEAVDERIREVGNTLRSLESELATLKKKVDAASSSSVIGVLLRNHRRDLPDVRQLEQSIRSRQHVISATQIEQIEAEELRREIYNIDGLVSEDTEALSDELTDAQRGAISDVLRELYEAKRDALDAQVDDYETYFERLLDLDSREQQLVSVIQDYRTYINERVLWVRSGNAISLSETKDILQAAQWLIRPGNLRELSHALLSDLASSPLPVALSLLVVLALNGFRWQMRRRLAVNAEAAQRRGCMSIRPTFDAALYTLAISAGLPLLIALLGWRASASLASTEYTRAVGTGLVSSAFLLWSFEFFREVFRRNGIGIAHFAWSESPCRSMARQIFLFEVIAIPLLIIVAIFDAQVDDPNQFALGRLALVLALLAMAVLAHRLLRYRHGALLDVIERARKRSNLLLRRCWYFLALLTPLALLVAAAAGYYYSALQISMQLHSTLTCAFGLLVFFHIVMRAMLITRRKIARNRARKKLEAMRVSTSDLETAPPQDDIDFDRVDTQAMRLIRSGFVIALACCAWFIWADDLPALKILNQVQLWQITETVTTETPSADGTVNIQTQSQATWITLRDAAIFFSILGITFIAVQNLPGLLEIILLQRMSLIAGERYAINMILGYILSIIGITWAFNSIGFGWGRLQWLVAAVGLGLGFGLQEIFANLVSGLIILFERPIRVGDTVTVGEISGTVSRIRIRATWITAFNRQELIVPNKEFVTGRLVNWTLSDQVLRVEVPVGIAYGSDVELAKRLMLEVAQRHPDVLSEPEPAVYFMGFGDSSLNFELRVHSPDLESFLIIKDAMHTGIDAAFREHNIEIPFPQRDVHVRSIDSVLPVAQRSAPGPLDAGGSSSSASPTPPQL